MNNAQTRKCRCCPCTIRTRRSDQVYCGKKACQRIRRNAWRRAKYARDPDYRLNQKQSNEAWLAEQGGAAAYHRGYRRRRRERGQPTQLTLPEKVKQPVSCAPETGAPNSAGANGPALGSANSDAVLGESPIVSGIYKITPLQGANSDAISVKLLLISAELGDSQISTQ